jgi:ABC-type multidrug transport system fused ATPase/permease subunit
VKLSGGQKQRIGIARALYNNPELLIFDEATSALDSKTEKEVMRSLDLLKGQKTIIVIAHRLTSVSNADYVYRLEKGHIIDQGKPEKVFEGIIH